MNNTHLLKQYNTQIEKIKSEIKGMESERNNIHNSIQLAKNQIQKLQSKIKEMQNSEVVVTEHTLLRYFERVKGFNLEDIKLEMLSDKTKSHLEFVNGAKAKIPWEGCSLVVENNKIITIEC